MTSDQIENFLSQVDLNKSRVQINFKSRNSMVGIFLKTGDFVELKSKNLWRIVNESRIDEFLAGKDESTARIFNGVEITKLVLQKLK